jgi:copper chaperone CopZ
MKKLSALISFGMLAGCGGVETEVVTSPKQVDTATMEHQHGSHHGETEDASSSRPGVEAATDSAPVQTATALPADQLFKAGDSAKLRIPTMTCRMCFKKIDKALSKVEGITSIELVPQEDEDKVNDPHVALQFGGAMSSADAVTALNEIGYPNATFHSLVANAGTQK